MNKDLLVAEIASIIENLRLLNTSKNLTFIIDKYVKTSNLLADEKLNQNLIKGSYRAYLEVFSDYNNPLVDRMYEFEKKISLYLKTK